MNQTNLQGAAIILFFFFTDFRIASKIFLLQDNETKILTFGVEIFVGFGIFFIDF